MQKTAELANISHASPNESIMKLGALLKQVREQRHFDLLEVAKDVGISANRLSLFEADDVEPSFLQLEKLADAYGVPVYRFVDKTAPNLEETLPDFRRANPGPAKLTPKAMGRIWTGESVSRFTHQLSIELRFTRPDWARDKLPKNPSVQNAHELRAFFDDWMAARVGAFKFAGTAEQVFLSSLRLFIEVQGVIVNINNAPKEEYKGFYLNPRIYTPYVFVNRSVLSKKSQLFTALHELSHHILRAEGISDPYQTNNTTEKACNRFAAEFLAPEREFKQTVERFALTTISSADELIDRTSRLTLLSRQATALRLRETGYLTPRKLSEWYSKIIGRNYSEKTEDGDSPVLGNVTHAKRVSEIGYLPTFVAKKAVDAGIIDRFDVESSLGLAESMQDKAFALVERRMEAALR